MWRFARIDGYYRGYDNYCALNSLLSFMESDYDTPLRPTFPA